MQLCAVFVSCCVLHNIALSRNIALPGVAVPVEREQDGMPADHGDGENWTGAAVRRDSVLNHFNQHLQGI